MDAYVGGLDSTLGRPPTRRTEGGSFGLPATAGGLFGAGMGSPYGWEPPGDAGEGADVSAAGLIAGDKSRGKGETYTPLPGILPTKDHLEYVQKFSVAGLLGIGFVLIVVLGIVNPAKAFNLLGRGAARQAGVA